MALWTVTAQGLAQVQVESLRSLPGLVLAFPTSSAFLKNKSKLFIVLRRLCRVPARKYIMSITPSGTSFSQPYLELALITGLYLHLEGLTLQQQWLVLGECDLLGNLVPLEPHILARALQFVLTRHDTKNWRIIAPEGALYSTAVPTPLFAAATVAEAVEQITRGTGRPLQPQLPNAVMPVPSVAQSFARHFNLPITISIAGKIPLYIRSAQKDCPWLSALWVDLLPAVPAGRLLFQQAQQQEARQAGVRLRQGRPLWSPSTPATLKRLTAAWQYLSHGIITITDPQQFSTAWWQELHRLWSQTKPSDRPWISIRSLPCPCGLSGSKQRCVCSAPQRHTFSRHYQVHCAPFVPIHLSETEASPETNLSYETVKQQVHSLLRQRGVLTKLAHNSPTDVILPRLTLPQHRQMTRTSHIIQAFYNSAKLQPEHWFLAANLHELETD